MLEKQLDIAQERLSAAQGSRILGSIVTNETANAEIALQKNSLEIDSLKKQLAAAEAHTDQFRKISSATEATLAELRTKSAGGKKLLEGQLKEAQEQLLHAQTELEQQQSSRAAVIKEAEDSREALRVSHVEAVAKLREVEAAFELAKQVSKVE